MTPPPAAQASRIAMDRAEPWKEDGNIVLAAEGRYFRVHRSVLSAHSEVFKDMFDCPYPKEAEKEFVELCPAINLHDTATDVQIMLKAMYDRSYPQPWYEKMPISVVAAFLHLGEKYVIPALVKEAKTRLCCALEPTLMSAASSLAGPSAPELFPAITDGDPHNFQIMNLLQEMDLKAPLPITMYQCIVTCPLTKITDGYQFKNSFCSLSATNLRTFIRMKDVLENHRIRLMKTLCKAPTCGQLNCSYYIFRVCSEDLNVAPPFEIRKSQWEKLLCQSCATYLKGKREAEMQRAWDQLPTALGLGSWANVRGSGDLPSFTIRAC